MPNTKIRALITAGAALLAMTHSSLAEGDRTMSAEEQNVVALIEKMTDSFEKGDIDTVMQTYESSQSIAFEPGQPVSDAAQSRDLFHQFRSVSPKFTYSGHEVIVEGDLAVHIAPWTMTGTDPEGKAIAGEGLSIAVLRRQPDGSWKMVIDNPHGSRLLPAAN
ncbi:YybH family protein [Roseibium sp. M-1]